MPQHLHFVDVETRREWVSRKVRRQVLWYGEYCYIRRPTKDRKAQVHWYKFTSPDEFWDALLPWVRSKTRHYLIAHNLKADARALHFVAHLRKRGWTLKQLWDRNNVRLFRWTKGKATLMIADNMNWFNNTIEE
ncbi:unnamed protein product, partial [marine sediment metagenome]